MPHFEFIAKDHHGKNFHGTLFSQTEQGVYFTLENLGYVVLTVHEKEERDQVLLPRRITAYDITVFTKLLATVVTSGMPLIDALAALEAQLENKSLQKVIRRVRINVENGMTLSDSFGKFPKVFPEFFCNMIRSGEMAGIMPTVLGHLATYLEKNEDLKRKVHAAMTYPKIVLTMAFFGTVFLIYFVIPKFVKVYSQGSMPMPLPTRILVGLSSFCVNYWWLVIIGIGLAGFSVFMYRTSPGTRHSYHSLALRIPYLGKINCRVSITRLTRTLSYMLQSGVPLLSSLETAKTASNNIIIEEEVARVAENVETGGTISGPLKISLFFPPIVTAMVASGERSGTLPDLLEKCADALDSELDYMIKRFLYIIEPAITIVLTVFIGFIAASLYLPIFYLVSSIPSG